MTDDGFSQRIQATDAGPMNRRCVRYACPPDRTAWPLRRCPYTSPIHRPPDGQLWFLLLTRENSAAPCTRTGARSPQGDKSNYRSSQM